MQDPHRDPHSSIMATQRCEYLESVLQTVPLEKPPEGWGVRGLSWTYVFFLQCWMVLLANVLTAGIPLGAIAFSNVRVFERTFSLTDPTIGYEYKEEAISPALSFLLPFICLVITSVFVEVCLYRHNHICGSNACAAVLHFVLNAITTYLVVILFTQIGKYTTGILRPDFLSRCMPDLEAACTEEDSDLLKDGRRSFPSGHSSGAMSVATYTVVYMSWSLHFRDPTAFLKLLARHPRIPPYVCTFLHSIVSLWGVVAPPMLSFFIAITRIIDNRHGTADVTAGLLVGILVTVPLCIRDINTYTSWIAPRMRVPRRKGFPSSASLAVGGGLHLDRAVVTDTDIGQAGTNGSPNSLQQGLAAEAVSDAEQGPSGPSSLPPSQAQGR